MIKKRPGVALALGGGGARGLSHIGVLKVFERHKIPIDLITGSSMGAIVGGAYCVNPKAEDLEQKVIALLNNESLKKLESIITKHKESERLIIFKNLATFISDVYLWNLSAIKGCIMDESPIRRVIKQLVNESTFNDAKIKFVCMATDINKGEEVVFTKGKLHEAIYASSVIPGVFPPAEINNRTLIDGGIIDILPAGYAKKIGAGLVIGIDVDKSIQPKNFKHGYDIIFRADDIRRHELNHLKINDADIIIEPDVKELSWAHFSKVKEIIKKGEKAAEKMLPRIKKEIKKSRFKSLVRNIFLSN